nr:28S ribosomal protein S26, mitochondrial-like [Dromaius novaehollandiae]
MAPRGAPLLLALLLLADAAGRCPAQHWSHGWYPGGKRDLGAPPRPQPPSEPPAVPRCEFRAEVAQKKRQALQGGEDAEQRAEEHRLLMAWNDAENARQRARREERIRKEEEERKRQKSQAAENKAKLMEAFLKEKEKEVLQLQEEAKSFITPENLDARIEECLDNPRNYNFAIDKEGRIVKRTVLS